MYNFQNVLYICPLAVTPRKASNITINYVQPVQALMYADENIQQILCVIFNNMAFPSRF